MKLYGIKACDTCRRARKALPDAEFIDVKDDGISPEVLVSALSEFGGALINRKSTTWRNLTEEARATAPLELLAREPTLMKRPLIIDGARMTLGWSPEVQTTWD
ncbi:MAG: ArsC/Spx/MgsR family protein [Pseudomonadota bacterium]